MTIFNSSAIILFRPRITKGTSAPCGKLVYIVETTFPSAVVSFCVFLYPKDPTSRGRDSSPIPTSHLFLKNTHFGVNWCYAVNSCNGVMPLTCVMLLTHLVV